MEEVQGFERLATGDWGHFLSIHPLLYINAISDTDDRYIVYKFIYNLIDLKSIYSKLAMQQDNTIFLLCAM